MVCVNNEIIKVIILAGGVGSRMGADVPKQYLDLEGKPVLVYSLIAFEKSPADEIYVVCDPDYEDMIRKEMIEKYCISKFAGFAGCGDERVWSVKNGVRTALDSILPDKYENSYIMIHDGARPLISRELILMCLEAVKKHNAAVPGIPLRDTIKKVSGDTVISTPDRSEYVIVQTPQCFRADVIAWAYERFDDDNDDIRNSGYKNKGKFIPTDDASLVEMYTDMKVAIIPGEERNIKITTPADMYIAPLFLFFMMK